MPIACNSLWNWNANLSPMGFIAGTQRFRGPASRDARSRGAGLASAVADRHGRRCWHDVGRLYSECQLPISRGCHKGRYVGIVGVYGGKPRGRPIQLRYELVALEPEYETPAGKDAENPIHALLQKYAEEVKQGNYLAQYVAQKGKYPEVQVEFPQATYAGSESCKKCHEAAYEIWAASPHPHAYETLVNKAKRPNLRQYDGECVDCHVTGFRYVSGFTDEQHTPLLKGVGCESCHGPASLHIANHKDKKLRAVLNPWKRNAKNPQDLCTCGSRYPGQERAVDHRLRIHFPAQRGRPANLLATKECRPVSPAATPASCWMVAAVTAVLMMRWRIGRRQQENGPKN
jgi:Cytochrome c554 and c-prime